MRARQEGKDEDGMKELTMMIGHIRIQSLIKTFHLPIIYVLKHMTSILQCST